MDQLRLNSSLSLFSIATLVRRLISLPISKSSESGWPTRPVWPDSARHRFEVNTQERPFSVACPLLATQIWSPGPVGQRLKEFLGSEAASVGGGSNIRQKWDPNGFQMDPTGFCMLFLAGLELV